jgi:outer membrane lipase/esterase
MRKWSLIFGIGLSLFASNCKAEDIESLLLFGDSYFDTGAGNAVAESLNIPIPTPTPPWFEGRHSNGPLWIDYVSQLIKLPYTDYAVAGSKTGSGNFAEPALGGLFQQLARFSAANPFVPSDTLLIVDGGGNDFFALLDNPSDLNPAGVAATTVQAITNLKTVFGTLQTLGAEQIIMWNLGDMGLLPLFTDPALGLTALQPLYSGATAAYNGALLELIQGFNDQSTDHKQIYLFDAFTVFNEIEAELRAEGISTVAHTITTLPSGGFIVTGPQPTETAFYDQVHPTTLVWQRFANSMAAFIDTLENGPRFIGVQQELAFQTSSAHTDLVDNHFRTLHLQRYIRTCDAYDPCCDGERLQIYVDGEGKWGTFHKRSGILPFRYNIESALLGLDYRVGDCLVLGTSFTAQSGHARVKNGHGKIKVKDYVPTLYAFFSTPECFLDFDISYHYHKFHRIRRNIPFLNRKAKAHTDGWSIDTHLQAGYLYNCGCLTTIPIAGLGYETLHINQYKERGAGFLDLRTKRQYQNSLISKLGFQFFWNPCDCRFLPFAEVYYEHEFLRNRHTLRPKIFKSNDHSIAYNNIGIKERDRLKFSLGVDAELVPDVYGNISYQGDTTFREYANVVRVEVNATF